MTVPLDIAGVLLAGGRSRRMGGGDKCLRMLGNKTLLSHAIARARPQVRHLALNANGDPERFGDYALPVIGDIIDGFAGPLAGVLTAMAWARSAAPACAHVATFPTDAPFFPSDLVTRLHDAIANGATLACARSGGRTHPVFGLWPVALYQDLREAVVGEELRKVDTWTARHDLAEVDFPFQTHDPFFNVNKPQDLVVAARYVIMGE